MKVQAALCLLLAVGCSTTPEVPVVTYEPAHQQLPAEPVYSRTRWSQLPGAYPVSSTKESPYFMPPLRVDLPNTTLAGAIGAVAKTIGYEQAVDPEVANRRVSLQRSGSLEEIVAEIGEQSDTITVVDHEQRVVRAVGSEEGSGR